MRRYLILLLLVCSCGCSRKSTSVPETSPIPDAGESLETLSTASTVAPSTIYAQSPLHLSNGVIKDSNGRTIILHGVITITHHGNGYQPYTVDDYRRLKTWGVNYQSIRLFASTIGADGSSTFPVVYEKLDEMVENAKQVGIYTAFKLTMYSGGTPYDWEDLWLNYDNSQDDLMDGWKSIWARYADEPAVIGYDLINEPEQNTLSTDTESEFVCTYLNPLYQALIDELQAISQDKFALIQPALGEFNISTGVVDYYEYPCPIDRSNVLYAPHLYAKITRPFSASGLDDRLTRYLNEGELHNAPLFIGEFGIPWNKMDDGNKSKETEYSVAEETTASLLDTYKLGFSRPWFADDNAQVKGIPQLNWALIEGTSGLTGDERAFITRVLARPYPIATAGVLQDYQFDLTNHVFTMNYESNPAFGSTEIFTSKSRYFPDSFVLQYNDSTFSLDASSNTFQVIQNPDGNSPDKFSWDANNEIIVIYEWTSEKVIVELRKK